MRLALTYLLVGLAVCTPSAAAERRSWNKIRYLGGTIPITVSPYDWNVKITVKAKPDSIVIVISPGKLFEPEQTLHINPSQVVSLSGGPAAWQHVAEVSGAKVPAKQPSLFGVLQGSAYLGIVFETDNGKRGALLLQSDFSWQILPVLKRLTGKPIEDSP